MITQVAGPGLEHGQEDDLGAEIFVVAGDVPQGAGAFPQEQRENSAGGSGSPAGVGRAR